MKRDYRLYLDDILEAIIRIEKYTAGLTLEKFKGDDKTADAVMRNFAIIGEAAKQIPDSLRKQHPDVPWKEMAGMRDKLVHEYFGIKYDVVWETIVARFPKLKPILEKILKEMDKTTIEES